MRARRPKTTFSGRSAEHTGETRPVKQQLSLQFQSLKDPSLGSGCQSGPSSTEPVTLSAARDPHTSTRTTSLLTVADFLNIAVAEQYFSSDRLTARSISGRLSFRPRTV